MPARPPSNGPGTFGGACFWLLAGAAAVYLAVRLILSVWVPLVVISSIVLVIAAAVAIVRHRRSGW